MSSDGSVSSGISQFGLYRTIDARTEEFLKLSKKRQIRQGCVCAAISTAITVTVVVATILIYEYNVMAEVRRTSHKSNWLDLMNNSADGPTLQERFNKANINIDRTTLKLLPILLKAFNQNRYVDKLIEEPTSLYPPYEKSDTTDVSYTKNVFADTRNWMKMPNSRLYAIEYKTSPIVYFKNPTRNVDYFTKIRKIRDYQRIMNYFDKMISERNILGSTQPMKSDLSHTEMPIRMTKPMRKHKFTQTIIDKPTSTPRTLAQDKNAKCKCSHKLGQLMQKLLSSIQHLLSYFSVSNANKTIYNCSDVVHPRPFETLNDISTTEKHMDTKIHDAVQPEITKTTSAYKQFLNRHKYTVDFTPTNNVDIRRDYTIKTIMNLLKPNFKKHNYFDTKLGSNEGFSTTNSYVGLSETNSPTKEASTESILKYLSYANKKVPTDAVTTVADYILQKGIYDDFPETKSSPTTFADTDFTTDDDYYTETTANLANHFERLDAHSRELIKNKIISTIKNDTKEEKSVTYPFKGTRTSQHVLVYNNMGSMRKVGNLVSNKNNSKPLPMPHRFAPITKPIIKSTTTKKRLPPVPTTKPTIEKPVENETKFRYFNVKPIEHKEAKSKENSTEKIMIEEGTLKAWKENVSKEITLKHIEAEIKSLNNETTTDQSEITTNLDSQWELVQIEENPTPPKSMMPLSRSTYLEIKRNDWKHEETHDYDTNMNNFFYE
ncbi:uncharacterized protein [Epargyreus clarus]|uniref:uncharacterized protein isoform X1 n=1 Tax=Epargyreus clarus TaxID=520877 RepID=UPI003C2D112C